MGDGVRPSLLSNRDEVTGGALAARMRGMDPAVLASLRRSYERAGLDVTDVAADPVTQFQQWLGEAVGAELLEPNAMVLATADVNGRPRARTVLLKAVDEQGFVFFTNYGSTKGRQLAANSHAAVCFPWLELERQVLVEGEVERVSKDETAAYFHERPHGSQLGAAASDQSQAVASRQVIEERFAELASRYPPGSVVPVPAQWGGYRIRPTMIEFWQGRSNRLHDRVRYRRQPTASGEPAWTIDRLAP